MSAAGGRRLILVAGMGRSGTSLITGILGKVGYYIPQPEIRADETNPRGFGEPAWVVEFHQRLMRKLRVTVYDSRPAAWKVTDAAADDEELRLELRGWLKEQFNEAAAVVVKDPRVGWFLTLWRSCAADLQVPASFIGMMRHPPESLASARRWYGDWQNDASRAAAWLNVMLETEHKTRDMPRAFVGYEDLMADWEQQVRRVGEAFDDPLLRSLERERFPQVDEFVEPSLHRNRVGWEELDVPASVRDRAERVWSQLQPLAVSGGDAPAVRAALDESRSDYAAFYAEAEAIAQSSVTAVKRRGKPKTPPPPNLYVRVARRIPIRYRKRVRRIFGF